MLRSLRPLWCRFREELELMSGYQLEKLRESRALVPHGLKVLVFQLISVKTNHTEGSVRAVIFPRFVGQQWSDAHSDSSCRPRAHSDLIRICYASRNGEGGSVVVSASTN